MASIKQEGKKISQKRRDRRHKASALMIMGVMFFMVILIGVSRYSLGKRSERYEVQETELRNQISEEKKRMKEIEELETYVGTDGYVEDIAREKLGMAYPNEILFEAQD